VVVSSLPAERRTGLVLEVEIAERLAGRVVDDEVLGVFLDRPGRWLLCARDVAGRHS